MWRLLVVWPFVVPAVAQDDAPRPNILLVLADDMGYSDIGCFGGEIRTPTIDALAANGLRFRQFYNAARCCPTRASLLTGLHPHQAGVGHMMDDQGYDSYRGDLGDDTVTIAEVLKSAGYATWMSGKWHVTKHVGQWSGRDDLTSKHNWPRQRGFDRFYGTIHGAGSFYDPVSLTSENEPAEPGGDGWYYTDAIADAACAFLREHFERDDASPFFGYVSFTAPHWPLHAPAEAIERYRGRYDAGWDALRSERYERMRRTGVIDEGWELSPRDPAVRPWEDAEHKDWERRAMEVYAAQIELLDAALGRILDVLREAGELDDTLVLFLADNGGCQEEIGANWGGLHIARETRAGDPIVVGNDRVTMPGPEETYQSYGRAWANASNTPFRMYKHHVHEGGIATPLVVHWPAGIEAQGEWRDEPGHLVDVMATCADVAGARYPETSRERAVPALEGTSLLPAFQGGSLGERALFWEHEGNRAVRLGRWKLVSRHRKEGGTWELYDLVADRSEVHDLVSEEPARVAELAALYDAWAERCGVQPWPVKRPATPK